MLAEFAGEPVYGVEAFKEKPDAPTAAQYVASGEYLWNSNMFAWKAATVLELFARFEPALHEGLERIMAAVGSAEEEAVIAREYPRLKEIAVDNAIIERADKVATIEADIDWSDIGSWGAMSDVLDTDAANNLLKGNVLQIDAKDTTVYGQTDKLIALVGVENLAVIETKDAILICPRDQTQRVKDVVTAIESDPERRDLL